MAVSRHRSNMPAISRNQFDYVFHLAAYAAEGLSHFIKRFNYSNNLIGSVNLINESVKPVSNALYLPPPLRYTEPTRNCR